MKNCALRITNYALISAFALILGCSQPEKVYINQPMVPIRLTHDGIPGWWLSDALYEATLLKLDTLQHD